MLVLTETEVKGGLQNLATINKKPIFPRARATVPVYPS